MLKLIGYIFDYILMKQQHKGKTTPIEFGVVWVIIKSMVITLLVTVIIMLAYRAASLSIEHVTLIHDSEELLLIIKELCLDEVPCPLLTDEQQERIRIIYINVGVLGTKQ